MTIILLNDNSILVIAYKSGLLSAHNKMPFKLPFDGGPIVGPDRIVGGTLARYSRGTKVEKMLTLAPERYTAGFCMVAKVILWCI